MADMTPLTDILNNDPATATPVQNNFQTIEAYINGTDLVRTDGTEVMAADLDLDGNTLTNISGLAMNSTKITGLADGTASGDAVNLSQLQAAVPSGAWTSWTPTLTQSGSVTVTNTRSRYTQIGRTVHVNFSLTITGSGTGGNAIVMSIPVTAAATSALDGSGAAYLDDVSLSISRYPCLVFGHSTTQVVFYYTTDPDSEHRLGISGFPLGLASGDTLRGSFTYEAAN